MKLQTFALISLIVLFSYSTNGQTDTTKVYSTQIDTVKEVSPDFIGVDVIVESEWGEPDTTLNANVFAYLEDKHPHITMKQGKGRQCEVRIMKGITIKILDHKTGKLLKTYKAED